MMWTLLQALFRKESSVKGPVPGISQEKNYAVRGEDSRSYSHQPPAECPESEEIGFGTAVAVYGAGTGVEAPRNHIFLGDITMLAKVYWTAWIAFFLSLAVTVLAGSLGMMAAVVFGFIAFGLVFMGMIAVLPFTSAHPAPQKVRAPVSRLEPAPTVHPAVTFKSA